MPYTGQITEIAPYVRTYLWVTIWYKYHDFTFKAPTKPIDDEKFSKATSASEKFPSPHGKA